MSSMKAALISVADLMPKLDRGLYCTANSAMPDLSREVASLQLLHYEVSHLFLAEFSESLN